MGLLSAILILALAACVVLILAAPLRRARRGGSSSRAGDAEHRDGASLASASKRGELEAAREAKYREIRDAELDYRTGKLSREDYDTINAALRAEAVQILDRLEQLS
jgi:hypothetical protein